MTKITTHDRSGTPLVTIGRCYQSTLHPEEAVPIEIPRKRFDVQDRIAMAGGAIAFVLLVLMFALGWLPGSGS